VPFPYRRFQRASERRARPAEARRGAARRRPRALAEAREERGGAESRRAATGRRTTPHRPLRFPRGEPLTARSKKIATPWVRAGSMSHAIRQRPDHRLSVHRAAPARRFRPRPRGERCAADPIKFGARRIDTVVRSLRPVCFHSVALRRAPCGDEPNGCQCCCFPACC